MRALLRQLVAFSLLLVAARPAYADGNVLGRNGAPASIASARLAVALGPESSTRWLEVTVDAADAGFLWVVPVARGARVGTAPSAWLEGLDSADAQALEAAGTAGPGSSLPVGVARILDEATLEAAMTARDAVLADADQAAFASVFEHGGSALVLEYPVGAAVQTTGVVRIDEDGPLDLELPASSRPSAPARLLVLATAPVALEDSLSLAPWLSDSEPATPIGDLWLTRGTGVLSSFHGRKIVPAVQPSTDVLTAGPRGGALAFLEVPDAGADASAGEPDASPFVSPPGTSGEAPPPPVTTGSSDDGTAAGVAAEGIAEGVSDAASGCGGGSDASDDSGSGCDSSSGSSDSSSGCSNSSTDSSSSSDCSVRGSKKHRNGVGVRILVFGAAALAWARRATRRAERAKARTR